MLGRLRIKLASALDGADRTAGRLALAARTWLAWPLLIGMGAAIWIWVQRKPSQLARFDGNKLGVPERLSMLAGVGAAVLGVLLLYVVITVVRRFRRGEPATPGAGRRPFPFLDTITRVNRFLAPLAALPLVAALRLPSIEKDSPKTTLLFAALAAGITAWGVYGWGSARAQEQAAGPAGRPGEEPRQRPSLARAARALAAVVVAALWAGYGLFFSRLAITNHRALHTRTTDLGYYDNIFYQSIHGRPLGCSFIKAGYHGSAHFDPLLVLLSPLYLIYPRAEMLLVLQSFWLGMGVVPVYLLAKEKLAHRGKALLLAAAWAAYPAMHGANMYEFHSLTLIAPLLVWLLYFYEIGSRRGYWITLALLLLCREDVALLMCFVGFAALLDSRAGRLRVGWVTIVASLVYFAIVKAFFMTSAGVFMTGKDAYSFAYYYEELMPDKRGLSSLLSALVTNPAFALRLMLKEEKIVFVVQLLLPLAFLPLFARPGRFILVYGALFCLLASRKPVYQISFQYSAVIFPIAFALTPIALRRIEDSGRVAALGLDGRRLSLALLASVVIASAIVSWKYGALVENASFRGGFARVARTLTPQHRTTYAWVQEQVAKIPPWASVGASNRLGAHISNRKEAYFYSGHYQRTVEYIFIDEGELKGQDSERHKATVARGELVQLGRHGKMVLYQRKTGARPPAPPPSGSGQKGLGDAGTPEDEEPMIPPPPDQEPDAASPRSP